MYDINNANDDKFLNCIIFSNNGKQTTDMTCKSYRSFNPNTNLDLSLLLLPSENHVSESRGMYPVELDYAVKKQAKVNFLGSAVPIQSQLKTENLTIMLTNYWDKQLLEMLESGFPKGFNRSCELRHDKQSHKSAVDNPNDIKVYLKEELNHGATVSLLEKSPVAANHSSRFMTGPESNSENKWEIVDLHQPRAYSVNDDVDKNTYKGCDFNLSSPQLMT